MTEPLEKKDHLCCRDRWSSRFEHVDHPLDFKRQLLGQLPAVQARQSGGAMEPEGNKAPSVLISSHSEVIGDRLEWLTV